ncbi:MAG: hypothetical protein LZ174_07730 [Thaumarchaeota archaeon]|jgi:hypothetical protein|nr:hypothetical protein [Candidatus Geocrenenecus arthurdayi]
MGVARRGAVSTAFSLAVLVLVIVFGVVGLLVSHTVMSSVQAEAVKAAERAAEAGREKLTAYIWKNVTSTGNITMLTLENRGGVGLSIDRAIAIGYSGQVLSEKALGSPISLGVGERRTMRLDTIFPGYTIYEDVKSTVKRVLFKTLRGSVFGSTYSAPERFEAWLGGTVTKGGTTVTLTQTSGETFTAIETVITTITNVTVAQGLPYWDADIYIVVALTSSEYNSLSDFFFPTSQYKAPDWAILPDLAKSGRTVAAIPRHVACYICYAGYESGVFRRWTGSWTGINDIYPRPTWAMGERVGCDDYYYPTYTDGKYLCTDVEVTYWGKKYSYTCWKEYFYERTSIPAGNITIKAPSQIVFAYYMSSAGPPNCWKIDYSYYKKWYFTLKYYIFYDAWNMSNVLLSGDKTQDTLRVDRPVKGAFVYVYSRTEVKLPPPPPPPKTYDIWFPNICISDDPGIVVGKITVVEKPSAGKNGTVTIDFSACPTCDAYVAPGPGIYDPSEVEKCEKSGNTATCSVPEGKTIIIDADPNE